MKKIIYILLVSCLLIGCSSTSSTEENKLEKIQGTVDQNVYANAYFNIMGNFDDKWTVSTEVDQSTNQSEIQESEIIFYAQKGNGMLSANVLIGHIGINSGKQTLIQKTQSKIEQDLASMNIQNVVIETGEEEFANQNASFIYSEGDYVEKDGSILKVYQKQYAIEKDEYVAIITLCSFNEDYTDQIQTNFQAME